MKKSSVFCLLAACAFIYNVQILQVNAQSEGEVTATTTAPLVISCATSQISVLPDEEITWTATLQSGDDPRNFYEWMIEGSHYSSQRGLGTRKEKFSTTGTVSRYILALQTYTTNEIGRFPCGTVTVNKFPLTNPGQKPDLVIDKVYFEPGLGTISPFGSICADIKNAGEGNSQGTFFTTFAQGNLVRPSLSSVPEVGKSIKTCTTNYATDGGVNNITITVDAEKRIDESNVGNNTITSQISIPKIPEASLQFLSPNSGTFKQGDRMQIRWQSKGMSDKVRIYYVGIPYALGRDYTIVDEIDNDGEYDWTVNTPYVPNGASRINVVGRRLYDYIPVQGQSSDFVYFETPTSAAPINQNAPIKSLTVRPVSTSTNKDTTNQMSSVFVQPVITAPQAKQETPIKTAVSVPRNAPAKISQSKFSTTSIEIDRTLTQQSVSSSSTSSLQYAAKHNFISNWLNGVWNKILTIIN